MIGIPDKKWTERPLLVVVPKPGQQVSSDELLSFFQVCPAAAVFQFHGLLRLQPVQGRGMPCLHLRHIDCLLTLNFLERRGMPAAGFFSAHCSKFEASN